MQLDKLFLHPGGCGFQIAECLSVPDAVLFALRVIPAMLIKSNAAYAKLVVLMKPRIRHILRARNETKIFATIVEGVPIYVVNMHASWRLSYNAMEGHELPAYSPLHITWIARVRAPNVPFDRLNKRRICVINHDEVAVNEKFLHRSHQISAPHPTNPAATASGKLLKKPKSSDAHPTTSVSSHGDGKGDCGPAGSAARLPACIACTSVPSPRVTSPQSNSQFRISRALTPPPLGQPDEPAPCR